MATLHTKRFGSFTATIEPNDDRPGVNCYVDKGRATASLECADSEGYLTDSDTNEEVYFPAEVGDAIRAWAELYGY